MPWVPASAGMTPESIAHELANGLGAQSFFVSDQKASA